MYQQRIEKVLRKCLTKCPHGYLTCRSDIGCLTSVRKRLIMLLCFVAPRLIQDAMFITIKKHPPEGLISSGGCFFTIYLYTVLSFARSLGAFVLRCSRIDRAYRL